MEFTKANRQELLEKAQHKVFDVLIVGGGIAGAGIALEASSRGLSTLLLEKDDFAEGTSSRSTKLVHGGLRYMKNLELKLVAHTGRERNILYQNAPHIVQPQKMILPIYKGVGYPKYATALGIWLYDRLAYVDSKYRMQILSVSKALEKVPSLKKEGLKGAIQYYEYKTNDARLVIENIKKSLEFGALAFNYTEVNGIKETKEHQVEVNLTDKLSGKDYTISARVIVNATGIWSSDFLKKNNISDKNYMLPSKGIHIVVDRKRVSCNTAVYFELKDHRMLFAIPKDDKVYIGTTDDLYTGDFDSVYANRDEVEYILKHFNFFFNSKLEINDVEVTWAGIRSLLASNKKEIHNISRQEKIVIHNAHFVSIIGGKLTAYRRVSEKLVNRIFKLPSITKSLQASRSKTISLSGANFDFDYVEPYKIHAYVEQKFYEAYQLNTTTQEINRLFFMYGSNIETIIDKAYDLYNHTDRKDLVLLEAEIWYVVYYEMGINLSDFMMRRSERFYFKHLESLKQIDTISVIMARYLQWSEEERKQQLEDYKILSQKNRDSLR